MSIDYGDLAVAFRGKAEDLRALGPAARRPWFCAPPNISGNSRMSAFISATGTGINRIRPSKPMKKRCRELEERFQGAYACADFFGCAKEPGAVWAIQWAKDFRF